MDILTNKQYKEYNSLSRYSIIPFYYNTLDNKYQYGTVRNLAQDIPYRLHTVKYRETYDTLALKYYHNPTYYWVICDFNRIQDPFSHPKVGDKIKIPNISKLEFE